MTTQVTRALSLLMSLIVLTLHDALANGDGLVDQAAADNDGGKRLKSVSLAASQTDAGPANGDAGNDNKIASRQTGAQNLRPLSTPMALSQLLQSSVEPDNSSANTSTTARPKIGMAELNPDASDTVPLYMQHMTVILVTLHLSVFVTGLVGNSLVCLSVYRNKSLQTVTNYYIVNLAVADFLVILICLPPTVYWDLTLTWNFGLVLCKLVLYLQVSVRAHGRRSLIISLSSLPSSPFQMATCVSIHLFAICHAYVLGGGGTFVAGTSLPCFLKRWIRLVFIWLIFIYNSHPHTLGHLSQA